MSEKTRPPVAAPPWQALSGAEVLDALQSSFAGLSAAEAALRRERFGPNALPAKPPPGIPILFLRQFLSPLIYVLLAAALVAVPLGEFSDAGFILAIVVLNAILGTAQEWKAERSAADLQRLLSLTARVRRDGGETSIPAEDLVPGDLVLLESGGRVSADLRLLECRGLQIDESLLTGESQAVAKEVAPLPASIPLAERANLAFAATVVASGRALGVVVATGLLTEVGDIARSVATTAAEAPPLVLRMERFARQVSWLVLAITSGFALVAAFQGTPWREVFFVAVALAVAAIPEGLPVAMTVALSIATSRMARRHVIVRRLTAVEGLGSCTCIASDKTGTLTVNRQTVRRLWLPSDISFTVTGEGMGDGTLLAETGEELGETDRRHLKTLAATALQCSEGALTWRDGAWQGDGDAMDVALHALGRLLEVDGGALRRQDQRLGDIPYEPAQRFAASAWHDASGAWHAVKGATEKILDFCTAVAGPDGELPLDRQRIEEAALQLAAEGYRVLAVARGRRDPETGTLSEDGLSGLTLLGLIGFLDPLRPDAAVAVSLARSAGVRVAMITGDHPATALAITRDLGLAVENSDVLSGAELEEIGDPAGPAFAEAVERIAVFARVTPRQKLEIVDALVRLGHYVAVTGDGVNDAPALRRAHIGVAMGSGTDVARETAEIIAADDSFGSIVAGIEEGRFAYDNIRKVIYLLIATGAAELILFALCLIAGLPLPLSAVQLIWLNLVTNGIQDVALAFEAGEPGAMEHPPRPPTEGLFNSLMIRQVLLCGLTMAGLSFAVWLLLLQNGVQLDAGRNLVLLLMVLLENVLVFNCRSERRSAFAVPLRSNRLLVGGVIVAQGVHILAMHLPLLQNVLGVAPVSFELWLILLGTAALLLVVMELFKLHGRRCAAD